jgi:hypothetical protein
MSVQVLTNCRLWVDGYDLSGHTNKLGLSYGAKAEVVTAFTHDTENFVPGLKQFKAAHEVLYEAGTGLVDEVLFARAAASGIIMSVGPLTGAEGQAAYTGKMQGSSYKPGFTVGGVPKGSFDAEAQSSLIHGVVAGNRTDTANGTGPVLTIPGPTVAQSVYAALHVLAMSGSAGPTLAVKIQSAALVGFGSPSDRIVIPTQSGVGAAWATPLGPGAITDGFWRISYTITGTLPSFTFVVVLGIQ